MGNPATPSPPPVNSESSHNRRAPKKGMPGWAIGCLIALLVGVVGIGIVGIAVALFLPAFGEATSAVAKARAHNDAYNLKLAIGNYFNEYRRFPITDEGSEDVDLTSEGELVSALVGYETPSGLNRRGIVFFVPGQASVDSEGRVLRSHWDDPDRPALYDSWGNTFYVRVDSNADNEVDDPSGGGKVSQSILVWSAGPDGDLNTWEDNVRTW